MPLPMLRRDGFCMVALASLALALATATAMPAHGSELRKTPVVKAVQRVRQTQHPQKMDEERRMESVPQAVCEPLRLNR